MHWIFKNAYINLFIRIALSLLLGTPTFAQVPAANQFMAFEGSLIDSAGEPVDLSGQSLNFYISAGGCYLFGESISTAGDSFGQIVHRFGNGTQLGSSPNTFSQNLFFGDVSGTTSLNAACSASASTTRNAEVYYQALDLRGTMILGTVPYAQNATMLEGKSANSFVQRSADTTTLFSGGTTGQYLTKAASGLTWSNISLTAAQVTTALGYTPASGGAAAVTSSSIVTALGYTPAASATLSLHTLKASNLSDLASATVARVNLGLGALATKASIDLSSTDATGTLAIARMPSFIGDISSVAVSATTLSMTVNAIRGVAVASATPSIGQVLTFNGTNWTPLAVSGATIIGGGGVSSVTSTNGDIVVVSSTTTPTLTLNAGTSANQILRLDASARIPAVDASLLSFNATQLTSGTLATGRLPAFTGDITSITGSSTLTVTSLRGVSVSSTAPTSGQVLKYNGSAWVASADLTGGGASYTINTGAGLIGGPITTSGTISVSFGTTAGSVAQGNDSRIVGAIQSANNLSDLASSATARTNLGITALATKSFINLTSDVSGVLPMANGGSKWTSVASGIAYVSGSVGVGTSSPTARLHIASGSATLAPLKITSGTLLTTPVAGSIESDGANLYFTDGSNIRRILNTSTVTSGAAAIDGASTINSTDNITLYPQAGSVIVSATTASTNANTGALIVKGGIGVNGSGYYTGSIYTAGNLAASGTISSVNYVATGTIKSTGNISTSGSVIASGAITATGSMTAVSVFAPIIYGSANSGGSLTLESTSNATKGNIIVASGSTVMIGGATSETYRFQIKSPAVSSFASAMIPSTGAGVLLTGEDTTNAFRTTYYDSAGQPRVQLAASATNFVRNNVVVGGQFEIPGNNVLSVHGSAAVSGSFAVSRTVVLGGGTAYVPLMFTSATTIATPVPGALEYDGINFFFTNSSSLRRSIAGGSTSGTIDNINKLSYGSGDLTLSGSTNSSTPAVVISNSNILGTVALYVGQNAVVSGSIKLSGEGLDTATTCTSNDEGKQRYNKTLKAMEFCNGSYWLGIQGVTSCPTIPGGVSFTLVGVAGTGDAFCITKDHYPTVSYYDAIDQCALKATVNGARSRICSEPELNLACKAYPTLGEAGLPSFGSGTTKYWIPADDNAYALDYSVVTGTSCSTNSTVSSSTRSDTTTLNSYRCCYQ